MTFSFPEAGPAPDTWEGPWEAGISILCLSSSLPFLPPAETCRGLPDDGGGSPVPSDPVLPGTGPAHCARGLARWGSCRRPRDRGRLREIKPWGVFKCGSCHQAPPGSGAGLQGQELCGLGQGPPALPPGLREPVWQGTLGTCPWPAPGSLWPVARSTVHRAGRGVAWDVSATVPELPLVGPGAATRPSSWCPRCPEPSSPAWVPESDLLVETI